MASKSAIVAGRMRTLFMSVLWFKYKEKAPDCSGAFGCVCLYIILMLELWYEFLRQFHEFGKAFFGEVAFFEFFQYI